MTLHDPHTSATVNDDADELTGEASGSLEAATRLVEPMRYNNLTPHDITLRHLRRARGLVRQGRRILLAIQRESRRILPRARQAAQQGQNIARTVPGQRRARSTQFALRRGEELRAHYDALQMELVRVARRSAAARDLLHGWQEAHPTPGFWGRRVARSLDQTLLSLGRLTRITRDQLDETGRALHHVDAAKGAMQRDSESLRLDPVTFTRFAGRRRAGVYVGIAIVLGALITLLYPPWSPPSLGTRCATVDAPHCNNAQAGTSITLRNSGNGILLGWIYVSADSGNHATQLVPLALLPGSTHQYTCDEFNICALDVRDLVRVQMVTSGGSSTVTILP